MTRRLAGTVCANMDFATFVGRRSAKQRLIAYLEL